MWNISTVYNQANCHLCPSFKDNHEHGNRSCIVASTVNNLITSTIIDTIRKENPPNINWKIKLWFSHNIYNTHIDFNLFPNFSYKWGNKGIIFLILINEIHNLQTHNPSSLYRKIIKNLLQTFWNKMENQILLNIQSTNPIKYYYK